MDTTTDIFEKYLEMRQSNATRELADMSMLQRMAEELRLARETIARQEELIRQQAATIENMKSSQPINNTYQVGRDYVANQIVTKIS